MTFSEDEDSFVNPLRRTRYYDAILPAMLFAAIAYIVWYLSTGLFHLAQQNEKLDETAHFAEKSTSPYRDLKREPLPTPKRTPHAAAEEEPPADEIAEAPPQPVGAEPAERGRRSAAKAESWRLIGTVYDLLTFAPIDECRITFVDESSGERAEVDSDASGRYAAAVKAVAGSSYVAILSKDGYSSTYLDPTRRDVRRLDVGARRALVKELSRSFGRPFEVRTDGSSPLVTDFYLAPQR